MKKCKIVGNKTGAVSLILVLVMTVLLVFMTAGWQSRLLLSLHRSRALSDILILSYHAESKIYDLISRFLGGYANAFSLNSDETEVLADGTRLEVSGSEEGRTQTLTVKAIRNYGVTKLEVVRTDLSSSSMMIEDSDIMFALDCTGSMSQPACDGCATTRMEEQKKEVLNFVDLIDEVSEGRIKVGISVFAMKSDWLYTSYAADGTPTGESVRPDANLTVEQVKAAIENGFGTGGDQASPACKKLLTYTSVGSGMVFMHDYLKTVTGPGKKQIEILITDGEPNQRIPYSGCPVDTFCPGDARYCCPGDWCGLTGWQCPYGSGGACMPYARDFLRCTLANTDSTWSSEVLGGTSNLYGVRDPNVDLYTVTVMESPPPDVMTIFQEFSTKHYNIGQADELSEVMDQIIQEIISNLTSYEIRRVVPTPIR